MVDFTLKILLTRPGSGKIALEAQVGSISTSKWVKGSYYSLDKQFKLAGVSPGTYDLLIQLTDPRSGKAIELPLSNAPQPGAYRICSVEIKEAP